MRPRLEKALGSRQQRKKIKRNATAKGVAKKPKVKKAKKSALCKTCGRRIVFPPGWEVGPSVRRHYWRRHPEVMRGER